MPVRKYSRQRESILQNLKYRTDHPTADMVYCDIRGIYPKISLGTVYRNLSLLAEEKVIKKVVTDDGVLRFDGNTKPHSHFICNECGCVSDLRRPYDDDLCFSAANEFKGRIDHCVVTFYGLCKNCLNAL